LENKKTDLVILDALSKLTEQDKIRIKNEITTDKSLWKRLLIRSNATYNIDLNHSQDNNVTQSLLQIYSSLYENTEILFILYWICQRLIGEPLRENFNEYKDDYGNILKGKIINGILKLIKNKPKLNDFKNVIEFAYYKLLRHLSSHTSAVLDNKSRIINSIDDASVKIPYSDVFQSMYSLQQLQNHLRMFINILLIHEKDIINEGFFSAITEHYKNGNITLNLVQLAPFFNYDYENKHRIDEMSVSLIDSHYTFQTDKEIFKVEKNSLLDQWYENSGEAKIVVLSLTPDVFIEKEDNSILEHPQYGSFLVNGEYLIDQIKVRS